MAFCIECGAKAPDRAKFCPQCGTGLVPVESDAGVDPIVEPTPEPVSEPDIEFESEAVETAAPVAEATPEPETESEPQPAPAGAPAQTPAPKSRVGLLVGLMALLAAGGLGGAYALGLFDTASEPVAVNATEPAQPDPVIAPDTPDTQPAATAQNSVLSAYQAAIRTGRISELGAFAQAHPQSSLAQDAQTAAFASLQRQGSELAYTTFTRYFPEADLTDYTGDRPGDAAAEAVDETVEVEFTPEAAVTVDPVMEPAVDIYVEPAPVSPTPAPTFTLPTIRPSITAKAEALDPFIAQGDVDYALGVLDELLALPDLNPEEATYLLNRRARAETSRGLTLSPEPSPEPAPAPASEMAKTEPAAPELPYDTPAAPIERFGAITPDAATAPGSCAMTFSVAETGAVVDIRADCTDPIFEAPALDTVAEWSYAPATKNGVAVRQDDLEVTMRFNLEAPEELQAESAE